MVEKHFGRRHFDDGEVIFAQGQRGFEAYLITNGKVRLTKEEYGIELYIDTIGPEQVFGEMAIISEMPRMATATAVGETHCLSLNRVGLQNMMGTASQEFQDNMIFLITYNREVLPYDLREKADEGSFGAEWHRKVRELLADRKFCQELKGVQPILIGFVNALVAYAERRIPPDAG